MFDPCDPALATLSLYLHSYINHPPNSPSHSVYQEWKAGLLMVFLQTSGSSSTHAHTLAPFPINRRHLSVAPLSYGSCMNNASHKPDRGQEPNGEVHCAVKFACKWPINNERLCISRWNIVCVFNLLYDLNITNAQRWLFSEELGGKVRNQRDHSVCVLASAK